MNQYPARDDYQSSISELIELVERPRRPKSPTASTLSVWSDYLGSLLKELEIYTRWSYETWQSDPAVLKLTGNGNGNG